MRSLQSAVERLISKKYEVSSHYLISRTGKIVQLVKDNNIACTQANQIGLILKI